MTQVRFFLFGQPRLEVEGQPVALSLRKAQALLAYLALSDKAQSRDLLATLFWPEAGQRSARSNLRRLIYNVSQRINVSLLRAQSETIGVDPAIDLWLDVRAFHQHVQRGLDDTPHLDPLLAAAELYRADFMAGFGLEDCPDFDEWLFFQREEYRQTCARVLQTIAHLFFQQAEYQKALPHARRWLALNPQHEPAHRLLMQLYAALGQRAAALRQYEECVRHLNDALGIQPEKETEALFKSIRLQPSLEADLKSLDASSVPSVQPAVESARLSQLNLPKLSTAFVGRDQELDQILSRLRSENCRLLTIVGPGGIGKTRLAIEVLRRLAAEEAGDEKAFEHGLFFVPLQPVHSINGVVAAIGEAMGLRFYGNDLPRRQLVDYLRPRSALLLLDNFEHLLAGSELVEEILSSAPALKLLVTSRQALNLQEEWFHPLSGMSFPQTSGVSKEGVTYDAVKLFEENARRAVVGISLEGEWQHVVRICRLVDGTPLALELAATWLRALPCAQIAAEIERNLDILVARQHNVPSRHRSMRAVLEQSWQLLEPTEQTALARLAVFAGGFGRAAAEAVAKASLPLLITLVEKSLIRTTTRGRYEMHELLRQFAGEQLESRGIEAAETYSQHGIWYLSWLENRKLMFVGVTQEADLRELREEGDNLRRAWRWAVETRQIEFLEPVVFDFYYFCQMSGRYFEGEELLGQAEDRLQSANSPGYGDDSTRKERMLARLRACRGALWFYLGDYQKAYQYLHEGLESARPLADQRNSAFILNMLGQVAGWQGKVDESDKWLHESATLSKEINDPYAATDTLIKLAQIGAHRGDYDRAKQFATEGLEKSRKLERPDLTVRALDVLGYTAYCIGEHGEAERHYQSGLELAELIDDQEGIILTGGGLGLVGRALGGSKAAAAIANVEKGLLLSRNIGNQFFVASRLNILGSLANVVGAHEDALRYGREGVAVAKALKNPFFVTYNLQTLADAARGLGDFAGSKAHAVEAMQHAFEAGLELPVLDAIFEYAATLVEECTAVTLDRDTHVCYQNTALELLTFLLVYPQSRLGYADQIEDLIEKIDPTGNKGTRTSATTDGTTYTLEQVVANIQKQKEDHEHSDLS